jgi:hypothetical protein
MKSLLILQLNVLAFLAILYACEKITGLLMWYGGVAGFFRAFIGILLG